MNTLYNERNNSIGKAHGDVL